MEVRRALPDGGVLVARRERALVPVASGSPSWSCYLADAPDNVAMGAPLPFVVASLLGYDPFGPLPPWLLRLVAELELELEFAEAGTASADSP